LVIQTPTQNRQGKQQTLPISNESKPNVIEMETSGDPPLLVPARRQHERLEHHNHLEVDGEHKEAHRDDDALHRHRLSLSNPTKTLKEKKKKEFVLIVLFSIVSIEKMNPKLRKKFFALTSTKQLNNQNKQITQAHGEYLQ